MATSNFHNENTDRIYVIDPQDEFEYESILENIKIDFKNADKAGKFEFIEDDEIHLDTELRSYPATSIGRVYKSFNFLGIEFEIQIVPLTRSGYYEAGNFDYEIKYLIDGETFDNIDGILYDLEHYYEDYDLNKGLIAIHEDNLTSRLENIEKDLREKVENIFKDNSNQYEQTVSFSNGETWYEKVS